MDIEIRSAAHAGAHVQVGEQTDAVRPRVRGEPAVAPQRQLGERARGRDPERQHHVGLVDVERIGLEREPQVLERARHLTAADSHAGGGAQRTHALAIVAVQRLLDPQHAVLAQALHHAPRVRRAEAALDVAGHPPPLVEVDDHVEPVTDGGAHGGHDRDPLVEPVARDPDLDRADAALHERQRVLRALLGRPQLAPRRVGGDPLAGAAKQHRDRLARGLPGQVPKSRLQRPVAAGVERDRLERPHVARDRERVGPDEQVLELLEPHHRVAAADADQAGIGVHAHDRRLKRPARHGIPGGVERRIERQPQALRLDRGDLHSPV